MRSTSTSSRIAVKNCVAILGPKSIGKTALLQQIQANTGHPTVHLEVNPDADLVAELHRVLRRRYDTQNKRPAGEQKISYLQEVVAATKRDGEKNGTKGRMVVAFDVRRREAKMPPGVMSDFQIHSRDVAEKLGCCVVFTTSDAQSVLGLKKEDRDAIIVLPEVGRRQAVAYAKQVLQKRREEVKKASLHAVVATIEEALEAHEAAAGEAEEACARAATVVKDLRMARDAAKKKVQGAEGKQQLRKAKQEYEQAKVTLASASQKLGDSGGPINDVLDTMWPRTFPVIADNIEKFATDETARRTRLEKVRGEVLQSIEGCCPNHRTFLRLMHDGQGISKVVEINAACGTTDAAVRMLKANVIGPAQKGLFRKEADQSVLTWDCEMVAKATEAAAKAK